MKIIQAKHRTGTALVLASAATIAFGCQTMPVYEIFKAGMDLHWQPGLDFFRDYGLSLIIIPHWNNAEGGTELDTSRCFMGKDRFEELVGILQCEGTIVGIDEHTSLWVDLANSQAQVFGKGTVHIIRDGDERCFTSGELVPLQLLGNYVYPSDSFVGIRPEVWGKLNDFHQLQQIDRNAAPPAEIMDLIQQREAARESKDFALSDRLRKQVRQQGWRIMDTSAGTLVEKIH